MDNLQNFRKISPKTWKKSGNCEKIHFSFHYFIRVLGAEGQQRGHGEGRVCRTPGCLPRGEVGLCDMPTLL